MSETQLSQGLAHCSNHGPSETKRTALGPLAHPTKAQSAIPTSISCLPQQNKQTTTTRDELELEALG